MRYLYTLICVCVAVSLASAQGSISGTFQGRYTPDAPSVSMAPPQVSAPPVQQYSANQVVGTSYDYGNTVEGYEVTGTTRVGPFRRWINRRRAGRAARLAYVEPTYATVKCAPAGVSYATSACNPTVSYSVGASNNCPCNCSNCNCPGHGTRFGQPYTITRCGPNGCVSTTYYPMPH